MEKDNYTPEQRFDDAMDDWEALEDALKKHPENEKLKAWLREARATAEKIIEEIDRDDTKGLGEAALSSSSILEDENTMHISPDKPDPDGNTPSSTPLLSGEKDLPKRDDEVTYVDSQGFVHHNSQDAKDSEVERWH